MYVSEICFVSRSCGPSVFQSVRARGSPLRGSVALWPQETSFVYGAFLSRVSGSALPASLCCCFPCPWEHSELRDQPLRHGRQLPATARSSLLAFCPRPASHRWTLQLSRWWMEPGLSAPPSQIGLPRQTAMFRHLPVRSPFPICRTLADSSLLPSMARSAVPGIGTCDCPSPVAILDRGGRAKAL